MKTSILSILFAIVFATACSKDDDHASPTVDNPNKYTYAGNAFAIVDAEYLYADGDTYLFFRGSGTANYVQIIFADHEGSIPTGTFAYNNLRDSPMYHEESNFWSGAVTTDLNPLGYNLSGGTVTILNTPNGNKVAFKVTTNEGTAEGVYEGTIRPR